MKYSLLNGVHIAEVPTKDFKIIMVDAKKKSSPKNSCNAGFFANFKENKTLFTLPVGHLVCDYDAKNALTKTYCNARGKFENNKFIFDSGSFAYNNNFYGKAQTTFYIKDQKADFIETSHVKGNCEYAIAGIPIMRDGNDVTFATFVKGQGWDSSTLYATWHIFVGTKTNNADTVYVMALKTTTSNMITSAEAYKKFKSLGMRDVIKLDGGGSFYFNADGIVKSTTENRQINTIITFGNTSNKTTNNPYPVPTVTLTYRNANKEFNKWLQWELTNHGYKCDIDGIFGTDTLKQVKAFQNSVGLEDDGVCGKQTREALLK